MRQLAQELRTFVVDNFLFGDSDGFPFTDDDSFIERGIIDSTGILQLVGFLEERYAIHIEADELVPENLDSISRTARFVDGKLQAPRQ